MTRREMREGRVAIFDSQPGDVEIVLAFRVAIFFGKSVEADESSKMSCNGN